MAEVWQWADQETYDEWLNELMENTPESYDDDAAAESIVLDYVRDLEGLTRWLLDHLSVHVDHENAIPEPVTVGFGDGWTGVPDDYWKLVNAYAEVRYAQ